MNKVLFRIIIVLFFSVEGHAQSFHINDSTVRETRAIYERDSLWFIERFDKLMKADTKEELENACSDLDRFEFKKWVKMHSSEIIKKLHNRYKRCSECRDLLSLTNNLPDSIRNEFLNENDRLRKARLGDSVAIQHYIDKYNASKKLDGNDFSADGLRYWLRWLLSFDSKKALDMIFSDIQSTRIIRQCETPRYDDPNDCFVRHYAYPYFFIGAFATFHKNEPIFNWRLLRSSVFIPWSPANKNPDIPEYYRLLEDFILKEYGYKVKINVPYLTAVEK
jgi:hypothetical protein